MRTTSGHIYTTSGNMRTTNGHIDSTKGQPYHQRAHIHTTSGHTWTTTTTTTTTTKLNFYKYIEHLLIDEKYNNNITKSSFFWDLELEHEFKLFPA